MKWWLVSGTLDCFSSRFFHSPVGDLFYEWRNPVNNVDPLSRTAVVQTERPENFIINLILEILPTDKEWKSNKIAYCRPWTPVVAFTTEVSLFKLNFCPHRSRTLQLCFVLPDKIRISPFHSHSLLDRLNYFLLISQVRLRLLAEVAHQMHRAHHYLSGFLLCVLIIALSVWAWNSRGRAAFKDNLRAFFLAVCCSTLSCNSGCTSVASRASFIEELSKHWSSSGSGREVHRFAHRSHFSRKRRHVR